MSVTTPITKAQVQSQLHTLGVVTWTQVQTFLRETRQFEKGSACKLTGESNGNTLMQQILANLKVADNLQWVSRRRIRHWTLQLYKEKALT